MMMMMMMMMMMGDDDTHTMNTRLYRKMLPPHISIYRY